MHIRGILQPESFWGSRTDLVISKMIPLQLAVLEDRAADTEPSHAIENFKIAAGITQGTFHGMVFQDSDVAKWIEAASYSLMTRPDADLENKIDEIVDIIAKAQQDDGYLNTYFTIKEPEARWTNLQECHEMYCAGHMIEGAVAYFQATGKRTLLDVMCRMADHIDKRFGPEADKLHGYPGHPELELALMRLYDVTHEERYAKLALYLIDARGQQPYFYEEERAKRGYTEHFPGMHGFGREYAQWHAPVREQTEAVGHAVRALYLYAGMAAAARHEQDQSLVECCKRLWDNVAEKKRYITGAYGGQPEGEAFAGNYELPNDSMYGETCASVAMIFFSRQMLEIERNGKYADAIENALFNAILAGMQLDGTRFFYCNPLEAVRGVSGEKPGYRQMLIERPKWFGCACCPPNLARLITSLQDYAYGEDAQGIDVHQYVNGSFAFDVAKGVTLHVEGNYPWDGEIAIDVEPKQPDSEFEVRIRIPAWSKSFRMLADDAECYEEVEKGYITLRRVWGKHTHIRLTLDMTPRRVYANTNVREDVGCVALMRGPIVYCIESTDNGNQLHSLCIPRDADIKVDPFDPSLLGGVRTLSVSAQRLCTVGDDLYSFEPPAASIQLLRAIPYYSWTNRGAADMRVWMHETH